MASEQASKLVSSAEDVDSGELDSSQPVGTYDEFADGVRAKETDDKNAKQQTWREWMIENEVLYMGSLIIVAILGAVVIKLLVGDTDVFGLSSKKGVTKPQKVPSAILSVDDKVELHWQDHLAEGLGKHRLMIDEQIKYKEGKKLYLVVAGHVFDVSLGGKTYEKGSGYHGFIGQDGTRAFITGKFDSEGLISDIDGLEPDELLGISRWINFYLNADKYKFVGLHIGTFFDEKGMPTEKMIKFEEDVLKAKVAKMEEDEKDKVFPSCNMEWSAKSGSKLWCSQKSGNIDREWTGFPRILKEEGKEPRCACAREELLSDPRLAEYKGCPADSIECSLPE